MRQVPGDQSGPHWIACLEWLTGYLNATSAALLIQGRKATTGFDFGLDPKAAAAYYAHFAALNPWLPELDAAGDPLPAIAISSDVLTLSELRRTEFYSDWGRKNDVVHSIAAPIALGPERFLYFAFNRPEHQAPFGAVERAQLGRLVPLLRHAALIPDEIRRDLRCSISEELKPVFVLDFSGQLLDLNTAGAQLLEEEQVLTVSDAGVMSSIAPGMGGSIEAECRRMTRPEPGFRVFALPRPAPLEAATGYLGPLQHALKLTVSVPDFSSAQLALAAGQLYGLTVAEAQLAADLFEAGSLEGVPRLREARNARVGAATLRSQLIAIYRKTGTRRQGELVRKLAFLAQTIA